MKRKIVAMVLAAAMAAGTGTVGALASPANVAAAEQNADLGSNAEVKDAALEKEPASAEEAVQLEQAAMKARDDAQQKMTEAQAEQQQAQAEVDAKGAVVDQLNATIDNAETQVDAMLAELTEAQAQLTELEKQATDKKPEGDPNAEQGEQQEQQPGGEEEQGDVKNPDSETEQQEGEINTQPAEGGGEVNTVTPAPSKEKPAEPETEDTEQASTCEASEVSEKIEGAVTFSAAVVKNSAPWTIRADIDALRNKIFDIEQKIKRTQHLIDHLTRVIAAVDRTDPLVGKAQDVINHCNGTINTLRNDLQTAKNNLAKKYADLRAAEARYASAYSNYWYWHRYHTYYSGRYSYYVTCRHNWWRPYHGGNAVWFCDRPYDVIFTVRPDQHWVNYVYIDGIRLEEGDDYTILTHPTRIVLHPHCLRHLGFDRHEVKFGYWYRPYGIWIEETTQLGIHDHYDPNWSPWWNRNWYYSWPHRDRETEKPTGVTVKRPMPYQDVSKNHYFYDAINWAWEHHIDAGASSNTFYVNEDMTRADMVAFLYQQAGCPEVSITTQFTDMPSDALHRQAISWAVQNGITAGTGPHTFKPEEHCTRAQMLTFMYRLKGSPSVTISDKFRDMPNSNKAFCQAISWGLANGLTAGITNTTFEPNTACSRGSGIFFIYKTLK